jgi:hypothetical protein
MKKEFNEKLFESTFTKHKSLLKESLLDRDEEFGDGYKNDAQRALAHSHTTQTGTKDDVEKANELARQGKFVVTVTDNIHCKSTDAVMGCHTSIHKVCDNINDAQTEAEKLHNSGVDVNIITPDSVKKSDVTPSDSSKEVDDVPFESVGNHQFKLKEVNNAPDKLAQKDRNAISSAFTKSGVDGNGRFTSVGKGISAVASALSSVGFQLDMVSGDLVLGEKGSRMLPFRRKSITDGQEMPEIKNSRIVFNWEKLNDNFEIQCYAS